MPPEDADETLAPRSSSPATHGATALAGEATLRPGALFAGRYEIQALLGTGGMGSVYRVRDTKLDEVVALKLLTLHGEHAVERFVAEVRLARRVTHPNVARTHDFGEDGRLRFLTMEHVPGTTLERIIEERAPLPTAAVVRLGAQIADGLAAAHEAGVVHRDLKPANVLVDEHERVAITDFGIARAVGRDGGTQTGALLGTPYYMAPEQVMGRPADERSDLYALGVILYELATGARPFPSETPMGAALARLQACPIDPRAHHPVDPGLSSVIMRCLAREPQGRPASAALLRQALRALVGEAPTPAEPTLAGTADSGSRPFAPLATGEGALAVLPFAYRGSSDHGYLGEAMAEELIDLLSRTRGLRVLSMGATRRFAESRDPAEVGAALGVRSIVDGTVWHTGDRVRLSVRMSDRDGTQQWSERFDGSLQDVLALQESLGRRVAEALRIELGAAAYRYAAPPEALELFLRARRLLRKLPLLAGEEAVSQLDRVIELAPDFAPAVASHAIATVRAWWGTEGRPNDELAERARVSVTRAQAQAAELAETHLATSMWEVQGGGFIAAARALGHALEIAPTMAEAHQYLGQLQSEAGRVTEGRERLELALELDPTLLQCHFSLGRIAILEGDHERARAHLDALWYSLPRPPLPAIVMRFRHALFVGDLEEAAAARDVLEGIDTETGQGMLQLAGLAFGETSVAEAEAIFAAVHGPRANTRFAMLMRQIATELYTLAGAREHALRELTAGAESALIDLEWIRKCSVLEPLRGDPAFARAERAVQRRAAAIWR
ncbi:MAG: protein kinase [Myxococcales bacterium]|nr:protein kinase [Myxococcales bacterium]